MRLTPSCRYYPSCSEYFLEAVGIYGIIRGCGKGFLRIIRCNPFFPGGNDPVKPYLDLRGQQGGINKL